MAPKINAEKSIMVGKLNMFNSVAKEAVIITDDELVNYDARFWRVVNDDVTDQTIRLEDIEAKRPKKKEVE